MVIYVKQWEENEERCFVIIHASGRAYFHKGENSLPAPVKTFIVEHKFVRHYEPILKRWEKVRLDTRSVSIL